MKILCVACIHGEWKNLPLEEVDAVIVAGDMGRSDKARKLRMENPAEADLGSKVTEEEQKEMTEETISDGEKLLRYLSENPVFFIFGNADPQREEINNRNVKPLEERIEGIDNINYI